MAIPATPPGYNSWNDYIETNAPALAAAQGLTIQQARASLKLLYVSEPIRSAVGEPYYREYNSFTTWADRALLPAPGRPWKLASSFTPLSLFAASEPGLWLDMSDPIPSTWRKNLLVFTDDAVAANWVKLNTTVQGVAGTAGLITETTATGVHRISSSITPNVSVAGTKSVEVKPNGRTRVLLQDDSSGSITTFLLEGAGSVLSGTGSIIPLADGWYRIVSVSTNSTQRFLLGLLDSSGNTSYTGDGVSGVYTRNFQVEEGTSYTGYQNITDGITEPTVLYPNNVLYQDTIGTPVTAVSQTVGSILDKSQGLIRGSELFNDSDVVFSGLAERISPGRYRVERTATVSGTVQIVSSASGRIVPGNFYEIQFTAYRYQGTNPEITLTRGTLSSNFSPIWNSPSGFYTEIPVTRITYAVNNNILISCPSSGTGIEIGNISVKQVLGNHAFQVTAASRPLFNTESGYYYLSFDGVDDFLNTKAITPGTEKAQMFAGVRKTTDAAGGLVVEYGITSGTGSVFGACGLLAPTSATIPNYQFVSRGSNAVSAAASGYPAPTTNVLTGLRDVLADQALLRVNGTQVASAIGDQGTFDYTGRPVYVGRRGTLLFTGNIYQVLVRFGSTLTNDQLTNTETWINSKTGAY